MQDIMERLGLPPDNTPVMDHNQAAIALAMAMQKARAEYADREGVKQEARTFGASKLDSLRRRLAPIYAAIPRDVEFLELGALHQDKPRLFVDVLAFVEMTRDQMGFRLVQETRAGRSTVAETQDEGVMVEAVTAYIARRLIDRERAMAAEAVPPVKGERSTFQTPAAETIDKAATKTTADIVHANDAPLTAEQAFRQWSRRNPGSGAAAAIPAQSAQASAPQTETGRQETGLQSVISNAAAPLVAAPAVAAVAKAAAVDMSVSTPAAPESVPVSSVAGQATTAKLQRSVAPVAPATSKAIPPASVIQTRRSSSATWLWPILALLIGAALGAAALYLYAASLVR